MFKKILVFAGTAEGHALADFVSREGCGVYFTFCVATGYGAEMIDNLQGVRILEGRLEEEEIEKLITEEGFGAVIDSTHPYAKIVTENIKKAAERTGIEYIRLLRENVDIRKEAGPEAAKHIFSAKNIDEAVEFLNKCEGNILLSTGSKELHKFTGIEGFKERVFARVLPSIDSIRLCEEAGIPSKNRIAMQGPFSFEMNMATLNQYGCSILVSKNTGKPGGFADKLKCIDQGIDLVVIERPLKETGFSLDEVKEKIRRNFK